MTHLTDLVYRLYARNLEKALPTESLPRHVGVILDGNRRWAHQVGAQSETGHRVGADKALEFLGWSEEVGIPVVTLWMLSTDNLRRSGEELSKLFDIICTVVEQIASLDRWHLRLLGNLSLLPDQVQQRLQRAVDQTRTDSPLTVNIAVGYGGREEITEAVRNLLLEKAQEGATLETVAQELSVDEITSHVYTAGQPDPDLVIRTSGEQRLSGFLMWQSTHSEYYFCEAFWPDFRKIDFYRALRDFALRERRMGK
ncbi:isoprenyl transferase [Varibaculum cambriense]|nr:isoprenyl transferase [Varibaculum cambriense]